MRILVINPGSTSTKMAVYEDDKPVMLRSVTHTAEEIASFKDITDQEPMRRKLVIDELRRMDIPMAFDAVIGRGGLAKPVAGGVYEINQQMLDDVRHAGPKHACAGQPWMQKRHRRPWSRRRAIASGAHKRVAAYAKDMHMARTQPTGYSQEVRKPDRKEI